MQNFQSLNEISSYLKKQRENKTHSLRKFFLEIKDKNETNSFYQILLGFEKGRFPRNTSTSQKSMEYFKKYVSNLGFNIEEQVALEKSIEDLKPIQLNTLYPQRDSLDSILADRENFTITMEKTRKLTNKYNFIGELSSKNMVQLNGIFGEEIQNIEDVFTEVSIELKLRSSELAKAALCLLEESRKRYLERISHPN
jgi:hypothetical protein